MDKNENKQRIGALFMFGSWEDRQCSGTFYLKQSLQKRPATMGNSVSADSGRSDD